MAEEDAALQAFDEEFGATAEAEETPASESEEQAESKETESKEEVTEEAEDKEESTDESQDETEDESDSGKSEKEPEAESEVEETQTDEEARKEVARQAYEQRQKERQEREALMKKAAQEHLDKAEDQQDLALRQLQIDAYQNKVGNNVDRLQNQYDKAVNQIEVFTNPTPEVAEALGDALDEFQARFVQMDELGNPVEVNGDLYQFLQSKAGLIQKLTQIGAKKERVAKAKEKAAVTPTPTKTPKEPKSDPIVDAFDKEFDRW